MIPRREEAPSGYLDFLGVASTDLGLGLGRALAAVAAQRLVVTGCTGVHLTVRDGAAARRPDARLGFAHERVAVPRRRDRARITWGPPFVP